MKEKIKLYGIGNEKNFNYYIIEKNQKSVEILSRVLDILGIELVLYDTVKNKQKKINFQKTKDMHQQLISYGPNNIRGDIFYGDKKLILILHCSEKLRLKFNEALEEFSQMSKQKARRNR